MSDETPSSVPTFYLNGFQVGLSNADISGALLFNNVPIAAINMSYTTAKTLSIALSEMIRTLEKVTQREIMTTQQVSAGLESLGDGDSANGEIH